MATKIMLTLPLLAGYLLDLLFGDPRRLPHPVRLFGTLIENGEALFNRPPFAFLKGMILTLFLCAGVFIALYTGLGFVRNLNAPLYLLVSSLFVFYGLANRQLIAEGRKVFDALQTGGVEEGRRQLSHIVGRDTAELDPRQIRIAVLETMSENLNDGVIAPLFFYAIAGLPGMMTYKMINTLDSMIGYRNPRYEQFGKFAARLDDLANYLPARLTALLMVLVTASRRGMDFIFRYGHLHKSPNAGYPEAALAGVMDLRFGGPNRYGGDRVDKPFIGLNGREPGPEEVNTAARVNQRVCLLMIALIAAIQFVK
jgi:adenosylcobinamide-phosphate synthase